MRKAFVIDIETATKENKNYRKVLYTGNFQLVLMSLKPKETIELEIHPNIDQFFRIESGEGKLEIGRDKGEIYHFRDGISMIVPRNTYHRIINTGKTDLKLYTIYSPSQHPIGLVQNENPENKLKISLLSEI